MTTRDTVTIRAQRCSVLLLTLTLTLACVWVGVAPRISAQGVEAESTNIAAGLPFFQRDRWGVVGSVLVNAGDQPQDVLLIVTATDTPTLQFATKAWLPAQSRRTVRTPLLIPLSNKPGRDAGIESQVIAAKDGVVQRLAGPFKSQVITRDGPSNLAILSGGGYEPMQQLVQAMRLEAGLDLALSSIRPSDASWDVHGYAALDCLIVTGRPPRLNPAQLGAVREWVRGGGHLWYSLEPGNADFLTQLLGDVADVSLLDTVEVNAFDLVDLNADAVTATSSRSLETPCKMVRIHPGGFTVTHTIDGYPAALRRSFGRGEVLMTTSEPSSWMVAAGSPSLTHGLRWFLNRGDAVNPPHDLTEAFAPLVNQKIGSDVLARSWVISVMVALALLVLLGAVLLGRAGRLEFLGPIAVLAGCLAAVFLVCLGYLRQSEVPSTALSLQLVEFASEDSDTRVTESVSIYRSPSDPAATTVVSAEGSARVLPVVSQREGEARVVWTDAWSSAVPRLNLHASAVTQLAATDQPVGLEVPRAVARFNAQGAEVEIASAGQAGIAEMLVVTTTGTMALRPDASGTFVGGVESVLSAGQYGNSALMSEAGIARQEVLQRLAARPDFAGRPAVAYWIPTVLTGVRIAGEFVRDGEALALVPLTFEGAAAGSTVSIPSPMMKVAPHRGAVDGRKSSASIYNPQTRQWIPDLQQPMRVFLRFDLPEGYGSLRAEEVSLLLDMRAPGRSVQLLTAEGGKTRPLADLSSPLGPQHFVFSGGDVLKVEADGSLVIGLDVGNAADPLKPQPWSVSRLQLSVKGKLP